MRTAAVALAFLALGAGLAGCGDDDGGGSDAAGGGSRDRFCDLASRDDIEGLDSFDPSNAADLEKLDAALDDLRDAAPSEIDDDVDTVADAISELGKILSTVDTSDPKALAQLADRADELEALQARMEKAAERVDRYLEEECGITKGS